MIKPLALLAWRNVRRHRLRSVLTAIGVALALLAFIMLNTMISSWNAGVRASAKDRLISRNKVSLIFYLPIAYENRVRTVPGVQHVGYGNWFGGIYRDERNRFAQFAVSDEYLEVYSDYIIPPEQREAWLHDKSGAIIGKELAAKFDWKVGDVVQLTGTIFPGTWQMTIRGIFSGKQADTPTRTLLFHWNYLNDRNKAEIQRQPDNVGFFAITVAPGTEPAVVAQHVDQLFANSYAETLTESETAFQRSFLSMSSTIILVLQVVSSAVLVIMLLVLTNTLLMSAREQTRELAIMRSLGFPTARLAQVIIGEGLLVTIGGFILVSGIVSFLFSLPPRAVLGDLSDFFPVFRLDGSLMLLAFLATILLAFLAALPAVHGLKRRSVAESLKGA